jgi:transcriptional regulator with XRE-family HTH domain
VHPALVGRCTGSLTARGQRHWFGALTKSCTHCKLTVDMEYNLGQKIRALRDAADLSLREFAKKLGNVTAAHLSDIELGRRFPSPELLERIARTLKVDLENLRELDNRIPLQEVKRLVEENPAFGLAFRRIVASNVTPEELLKAIEANRKKRHEDTEGT